MAGRRPGPDGPADRVPSATRLGSYETWTLPALRQRARELGLTGYAELKKPALVELLRRH